MAINAIQGPVFTLISHLFFSRFIVVFYPLLTFMQARSLLPDIVPSEQLYLGNALIALMTGLGSLAGRFI
jgi:hypothetical protein